MNLIILTIIILFDISSTSANLDYDSIIDPNTNCEYRLFKPNLKVSYQDAIDLCHNDQSYGGIPFMIKSQSQVDFINILMYSKVRYFRTLWLGASKRTNATCYDFSSCSGLFKWIDNEVYHGSNYLYGMVLFNKAQDSCIGLRFGKLQDQDCLNENEVLCQRNCSIPTPKFKKSDIDECEYHISDKSMSHSDSLDYCKSLESNVIHLKTEQNVQAIESFKVDNKVYRLGAMIKDKFAKETCSNTDCNLKFDWIHRNGIHSTGSFPSNVSFVSFNNEDEQCIVMTITNRQASDIKCSEILYEKEYIYTICQRCPEPLVEIDVCRDPSDVVQKETCTFPLDFQGRHHFECIFHNDEENHPKCQSSNSGKWAKCKMDQIGCGSSFENGVDYYGNELKNIGINTTPSDCQKECQKNEPCEIWTWNKNTSQCYLKFKKGLLKSQEVAISGNKYSKCEFKLPAAQIKSEDNDVIQNQIYMVQNTYDCSKLCQMSEFGNCRYWSFDLNNDKCTTYSNENLDITQDSFNNDFDIIYGPENCNGNF